VLLRETAVATLAPNFSVEQWEEALRDPAPAVRRAAVNRAPRPLPDGIRTAFEPALEDSDERTRLAALSVCEGVEPRLPNGRPIPYLTTIEKMFALRESELLAHMSAPSLHALAQIAEEEVFDPGEVLYEEGEFGDSVYILLEGHTEVVKRQERGELRVGYRFQGECVGEMSVLDHGPQLATVRASEAPVRVLTVRGDDFRTLMGRDMTTTLNVIRLLINRRGQAPQPSPAETEHAA
jgi:cyclic nucleotide-binding protein